MSTIHRTHTYPLTRSGKKTLTVPRSQTSNEFTAALIFHPRHWNHSTRPPPLLPPCVCHLARPLFPCAGVPATKTASKRPTLSISTFCDEKKRRIEEGNQSIRLQAKSSPPTLASRNPSELPDQSLYRIAITRVLYLVRRVRQLPSLPRKPSTLENTKTTNGQRSSGGQTGVIFNHSSARPPAESLLRLLLPLIFWIGRPPSHGWSLPIALGQSEGLTEPFNR